MTSDPTRPTNSEADGTADFLLEIGVEELPASYIMPALDALAQALEALLRDAGLRHGPVTKYATPRRLTVHLQDLPPAQESRRVELHGPPARIAFDEDGKPTRAAVAFAAKNNIAVDDLDVVTNDRGRYVVARKREEGARTIDLLRQALPGIIGGLPFPKSMVWNASAFRFARPVRSVLALLGADVVPFEIAGVASSRETSGHPFLSGATIALEDADRDTYRTRLADCGVTVDQDARKAFILKRIKELSETAVPDPELLDEVTFLVEFPNVLLGSFDEQFLSLPDEVLETAMKSHQRYFPVRDAGGNLTTDFLCVFNRSDEYAPGIREGNERVLAARLADARFFWQEDTRSRLEDKADGLRQVSYLHGLGTYLEKTERIAFLAETFAPILSFDPDTAAARRAAELAKADLVTQMVFEFPSLQGIIGSHYARHDGEDEAVCRAVAEQYLPRYADDDIPRSPAGIALALADKLDHIVGCFLIGKTPTGRQDPFAVRRATQGVIRIILENALDIDLNLLLGHAAEGLAREETDVPLDNVKTFLRDRLYQLLIDRGERFDLVRATLGAGFGNLVDVEKRLAALTALSKTDIWPNLVELVERTHKIAKGAPPHADVDPDLLTEPQERELWDLYASRAGEVERLIDERQYQDAARLYTEVFARPTHDFFDQVYVNVEDETVRRNRLALCAAINTLFSTRVADLSDIAVE